MTRRDYILGRIEPADRVLHVGCCGMDRDFDSTWRGGNALHMALERHVPPENLLGIDINARRLQQMVAWGYYVEWWDAEDLGRAKDELVDCDFNVIVAADVIEHLACPGDFLRGAHKILPPGGKIILTTNNIWGFWCWFLYGIVGREEPWPEHLHYYTPRALRGMVERHGFSVTDTKIVNYEGSGRRWRWIKATTETWPRMKACLCMVAAKKGAAP